MAKIHITRVIWHVAHYRYFWIILRQLILHGALESLLRQDFWCRILTLFRPSRLEKT